MHFLNSLLGHNGLLLLSKTCDEAVALDLCSFLGFFSKDPSLEYLEVGVYIGDGWYMEEAKF